MTRVTRSQSRQRRALHAASVTFHDLPYNATPRQPPGHGSRLPFLQNASRVYLLVTAHDTAQLSLLRRPSAPSASSTAHKTFSPESADFSNLHEAMGLSQKKEIRT